MAGVKIEHNVYCSDHFPNIIECDLIRLSPKIVLTSANDHKLKIKWGERKSHQIESYHNHCNEELENINFLEELINRNTYKCTHFKYLGDIVT